MSAELQALARDIINRRNRRRNFFPAPIFNEIAWEILLVLYAFDEPIHTSAFVAQRLQCPATTGHRWIEYLVSQGLVARLSLLEDERTTAIILTSDGRRRIENYLAGLMPRT